MAFETDLKQNGAVFTKPLKYIPKEGAIEQRIFPEEYFSGCDVRIKFNGKILATVSGINYQIQEQHKPIYGYGSKTFDSMAKGNRIVTGQISIPVTEVNKLKQILLELETQYKNDMGYGVSGGIGSGDEVIKDVDNALNNYMHEPPGLTYENEIKGIMDDIEGNSSNITEGTGVIIANEVLFYFIASTASSTAIHCKLSKGTVVGLIKEEGELYRISYNDKIGWVRSSYLGLSLTKGLKVSEPKTGMAESQIRFFVLEKNGIDLDEDTTLYIFPNKDKYSIVSILEKNAFYTDSGIAFSKVKAYISEFYSNTQEFTEGYIATSDLNQINTNKY